MLAAAISTCKYDFGSKGVRATALSFAHSTVAPCLSFRLSFDPLPSDMEKSKVDPRFKTAV